MNFLDLFDHVVRDVKTLPEEYAKPNSLDAKINEDLAIDSLDFIMVLTIFGEIYGVSEEDMNLELDIATIGQIQDCMREYGTRFPDSIEQALEWME